MCLVEFMKGLNINVHFSKSADFVRKKKIILDVSTFIRSGDGYSMLGNNYFQENPCWHIFFFVLITLEGN